VTDFGIARAISAAGGDSLTEIGIAVGTPEYMSPEQAAGESDLDGRSDVYALGLVLYEMLAGEVPLTGATFRATQARRMTETPAPISTVRPAVPPRVDQVIRRALDPVPADRFSTATQLEPRRPATTSVAVIPFANLSPDPDNVYFSDGITEELINALARVEGLQVAARTSVFAFRGRPEDVREIGRQLGVGAILEGSVRKHGNRLRIAAQLVNVSDGYQMWSNTFDREFEDIFLIQEEISRAIIENLRVKLLPSAEQVLASHGTSNADAYNTYLKGRYHLQQRNWQAFERAIECFHQAIAADSGYAPSYAGLADAYLFLERYGVMPPDTAFPKAREACLKALETGPHLAEAHVPLAYLRMIGDWDSTTAEREFQRALALNPDSTAAHHLYAWFLASRGRLAEALGELDRALAVEPFRLISLTNRGTVLYFSREYEAAVDQLTNTLDLNGSFAAARQWLGRTLQAMGRHSAAVTQHRRAFELLGDDPESIASLGHALGGAGQHEEALSLAQRLEGLAATKYVAAYWEALLRLGLGEVERAIDGFEKAYEEHFDWVLFLHVDPIFDSLKGHARFERLIERVRQASA
jgi:TolB-like protein/Tfp pilus assembly protein PilF